MAGLGKFTATGQGGPGDLARGVGKKAAKKWLLTAGAPAGFAVLLVGLMIMSVIGMGASGSYTSAKSAQVVQAAGVPADQLTALMYATQSTGIPYQLLAALAQGETGKPAPTTAPAASATGSATSQATEPPHTTSSAVTTTAPPTAPYGIFAITEDGLKPLGLDAEDAVNVSKSAKAIARFLKDQLSGTDFDAAGGLLVGASPTDGSGDLGMQIDPKDEKAVADAKKQEDTVVAAMVKLPLARHDEAFMRKVYELARSWAFAVPASIADCPTGGTVSGYTGDSVEGLNSAMTGNAWTIVQVARQMNLGDKGAEVALAAALAESNLLNYANDGSSTDTKLGTGQQLTDAERAVAKQSMQYPHDAVGHNLDSMGLFQQRPSSGWGAPAELMDPATSARKFYDALKKTDGWESMSIGRAAQTVQGSPSSDGGIYTQKAEQAEKILTALDAAQPTQTGTATAAPTSSAASSGTGSTTASTAAQSAAPAAPTMPYPLPATHGYTGQEEAIDADGRVGSGKGRGIVTFSQFASLGQQYRDFYITMRWHYASWNFNGTSTDIDQAEFKWMADKPRLVLVTNPRTGKSIIAAALEAGPAPWVGVLSSSSSTDPDGVWTNPTRGTPAGYTGIVSGFPPAAIEALGAKTGYPGQQGDDLIYQWAPDQDATPGPTSLTASEGGTVIDSDSVGCSISGGLAGNVTANGPLVTIPDDENVPGAIRGKTIQAPTDAMAKGLAAGFNALGLPYVWGGGADGTGPDSGCARAGGEKNSCQGIIGFDCSGLTAYVLFQGGAGRIPGNSGSQRAGGTSVSWDQGLPGDIIGYPGHVAIYLGVIDGVKYQLEAPDVGMEVRVTTLFRDDMDSELHRYWKADSAAPAASSSAAQTTTTGG